PAVVVAAGLCRAVTVPVRPAVVVRPDSVVAGSAGALGTSGRSRAVGGSPRWYAMVGVAGSTRSTTGEAMVSVSAARRLTSRRKKAALRSEARSMVTVAAWQATAIWSRRAWSWVRDRPGRR